MTDKRVPHEEALQREIEHRTSWASVVHGFVNHNLFIGSREPIRDVPIWATPRVITGGFVTGELLASLDPNDRGNEYFLTDSGFSELDSWLDSGCYRIKYPEHGALLSVAWLTKQGRIDDSKTLLSVISPYFDRIRFYPEPAETPICATPRICVASVGEVSDALISLRQLLTSPNLEIPRFMYRRSAADACSFWIPFKLRLITLFGETVNSKGWPLQVFESDWLPRAEALLAEYRERRPLSEQLLKEAEKLKSSGRTEEAKILLREAAAQGSAAAHFSLAREIDNKEEAVIECRAGLAKNPEDGDGWALLAKLLWKPNYRDYKGNEREESQIAFQNSNRFERARARIELNKNDSKPGTNMHTLVQYLQKCVSAKVSDSVRADISPRMVGLLKHVILVYRARYGGLPGSDEFKAGFAERQKMMDHQLATANSFVYVDACINRLSAFDPESGLEDIDDILAPVTIDGALRELPKNVMVKVRRCQLGSLGELINRRLITSSEAMARLVNQLSSAAITSGIPDPSLRSLAFATRAAFFRRRSLLLVDLASQVKLAELPWCEPFVKCDSKDAAAAALKELVTAALEYFPFTILPNKLLQSLRDLVNCAVVEIPLVDELAADIFQGRFSAKFLHAAQLTAKKLAGTVYATHYGLNEAFTTIKAMKVRGDKEVAAFTEMCCEAFPSSGYWRKPAENGLIIEQCQVLTSHNLIPLISQLGLKLHWKFLVEKVWYWILRAFKDVPTGWVQKLRLRKDVAYAWRQLVVYLSLADCQAEILQRLKEWDTFSKGVSKVVFDHCVEAFVNPLEAAVAGNTKVLALRGWSLGNETRSFFPPLFAPRLFD